MDGRIANTLIGETHFRKRPALTSRKQHYNDNNVQLDQYCTASLFPLHLGRISVAKTFVPISGRMLQRNRVKTPFNFLSISSIVSRDRWRSVPYRRSCNLEYFISTTPLRRCRGAHVTRGCLTKHSIRHLLQFISCSDHDNMKPIFPNTAHAHIRRHNRVSARSECVCSGLA